MNRRKTSLQIPADWIWRTIGQFAAGRPIRNCPCSTFASADGRPIGWLLGYPIDPANAKNASPAHCRCRTMRALSSANCIVWAAGLPPSLVTDKWKRYYPDAAGSLAAFLCSGRRVIASTPAMIRGLQPLEPDLLAALHRATQALRHLVSAGHQRISRCGGRAAQSSRRSANLDGASPLVRPNR